MMSFNFFIICFNLERERELVKSINSWDREYWKKTFSNPGYVSESHAFL